MTKSDVEIILLVEDTVSLAAVYEENLVREGYTVVPVTRGNEAIEFLDRTIPAAIVLDLSLPDISGMEVLRRAQRLHPYVPVIVVTGDHSTDVAVEAMNAGASDFIVKPFIGARLTVTVRNAIEHTSLLREVMELRHVIGQSNFYDLVGQSSCMQGVYRVIESIATTNATVFIRGESGAGKELAARAIHKASPRREKPFVAVDCGAIPYDQLESHLFGYVRGAFAGATEDHMGAILAAEHGTLFLDEICEMPTALQAKLFRFLQTGEFRPVGSSRIRTIDARVIAATSHEPLDEVRAGNLREDLYYRLNIIPLEMPSLREREEDVALIAQHFLKKFNAEEGKKFSGFDTEVLVVFRRYDWPGNVRQLENVVRNIVILGDGPMVTAAMLPGDLQRFAETGLWPANENAKNLDTAILSAIVPIKPLWLTEKEAIKHALDFTGRDLSKAATLLQISPSALYRKLQAWKEENVA